MVAEQFNIIAASDRYLMPVYQRAPVAFVRGQGALLWDSEGKRYIDFFSSLAVCNLGHCHPEVVEATKDQASKLFHVSNLHYCEPQARLAQLLCENSCADRVFFCNSGAEANEAAIKLARRWGNNNEGRYEIVTTLGSFHGRTLATITASGQEKVRRGFEPLPAGFRYVPYDDPEAVRRAITDRTAAVMVEPIQGEGGVVIPAAGYLDDLRKICDEAGILLILDEVQTGMGRTGRLFGYQLSNAEPDIFTLAKALANGMPAGAMLAREPVARCFEAGAHGSTFGGNALATAAAVASLKVMMAPETLAHAREIGNYFLSRLNEISRMGGIKDRVTETRGVGLMLAMELKDEGADIVRRCLDNGLLINCTASKVLRFLPPLTINKREVDAGLSILSAVLGQ